VELKIKGLSLRRISKIEGDAMRSHKTFLALAVLICTTLLFTACPNQESIARISADPGRYQNRDVIVSGRAQGMQFMDDAIFALLQKGIVSPHEAFMKAIDKNRFKQYLPAEEAALGNAAGSVPDDEQKLPGNFVKQQRRA